MSKNVKKNLFISLICVFIIAFTLCLSSVLLSYKSNMKILEPLKLEESESLKLLNNIDYPNQNNKQQAIKESSVAILNNFAINVTNEVFKKSENEIFSPISLYMALSMLLEGVSDSIAEEELIKLLGLEQENLRNTLNKVYDNNYYSNTFGRMYMANSIWISDSFSVNSAYSKVLKNHYFAESYHVDFKNKDSKESIIKWLNYYTENLLDLSLSNYPIKDNLAILLINTIYFNNEWLVKFDENSTRFGNFSLDDKTNIEIEYMLHQIETKYKVTEDYTIVQDYFENGNTITYLMPNVKDFFYSNNIMDNLEEGTVNLAIPKFKLTKSYDLKENLKKLGINKIFEKSNSLEKIGENLFVDYIRQDVGIDFSENGVEAAASTSIGISKTSLPHGEINISLTKPYYYCIKDASGIVLFVGYVNNPNQI